MLFSRMRRFKVLALKDYGVNVLTRRCIKRELFLSKAQHIGYAWGSLVKMKTLNPAAPAS